MCCNSHLFPADLLIKHYTNAVAASAKASKHYQDLRGRATSAECAEWDALGVRAHQLRHPELLALYESHKAEGICPSLLTSLSQT
jgi:hypothetical protein